MNPSSVPPPRIVHPHPRAAEWREGALELSGPTRLRVTADIPPLMRQWMADLWRRYTLDRLPLEIVENREAGAKWTWQIGETGAPPVIQERDTHALAVGATGVAAAGTDEAGARHAWETLLQLLWLREVGPNSATVVLPQVTIHDGPLMAFRGLHLCVFPETDPLVLRKVIHLAGLLKYSHVVLEFWGMLKLETLRELSWPFAWTKAQAQDLIAIAASWGMEVVPMFNMWGHAASCRIRWGRHVVLDQNPALAPLFEPDGWAWCLSNPRTKSLLRDVAVELCEFSGPGGYFHIGCDESYSHATCDHCRTKDRIGLWSDHVNAMAEHVLSLGRRPIMWGDALLEQGKWPVEEANGTAFLPTHQAIDAMDRRIIIADWHYEILEGDVPTMGYFRSKGFDVLASPWHKQPNIRTMADAAVRHQAMGTLATTWTALAPNMPMLSAAANSAWSAHPGSREGLHGHWGVAGTHLAAQLRLLTPSGGDYAKAGWHRFELSSQE